MASPSLNTPPWELPPRPPEPPRPAPKHVVAWRTLARDLGYGKTDLDAVASFLATPSPDHAPGESLVCHVDRVRILVASKLTIVSGVVSEKYGDLRTYRVVWGISAWRKSSEAPETQFYSDPPGTTWCMRHGRHCEVDEEGECARALREIAEEAKVTLVRNPCQCPKGWLGEHWRDCPVKRKTTAATFEAMFADVVVEPAAAAPVEAPPAPVEPPARPKPLQGKLF